MLDKGLRILSFNGNIMLLDTEFSVTIDDNQNNRKILNRIVNQLISGKANFEVGVVGLLFGYDKDPVNIIDSFGLVNISFSIARYNQSITKYISQASSYIFNNAALVSPFLDLDVFDENTFKSNIKSKVRLPFDIQLDPMFFSADIYYNHKSFVKLKGTNLMIVNTSFSTVSYVNMPLNREAANNIMLALGSILFNLPITDAKLFMDNVTVGNINFGPSPGDLIQLFSGTNITLRLQPLIRSAMTYFDQEKPVQLNDVNAILNPDGVYAKALFTGLDIQLKSFCKISAKLNYQKLGIRNYFYAADINISQFENYKNIDLMIYPITDPINGLVPIISDLLPTAVQFKNFARFFRMGFVTFTGSNGKKIRNFDEAYMMSPSVSLFDFVVINIKPEFPSYSSSEGFSTLFSATISLRNTGPLHLDFGRLSLELFKKSKTFSSLNSNGNIVILSNNEGADVIKDYPAVAELDGAIWLSSLDGNPFQIVSELFNFVIYDMTSFNSKFSLIRSGQSIEYSKIIFNQVADQQILRKIIPYMSIITQHIIVEVFGFRMPFKRNVLIMDPTSSTNITITTITTMSARKNNAKISTFTLK